MSPSSLLAAVGTVLAACLLVPQMVRLFVRGDTAGLSPTWAGFGVVTNLAWVIYLGAADLWPAVGAPALAVLAYAVTLRLIVTRSVGRSWLRASSAYMTGLVWVAAVLGPNMFGRVLSLAYAVQLAPGIAAVYRSDRPTGVSPFTWLLVAVEAVIWGGYGWLHGDPALIGYGAITLTGAIVILSRCVSTGVGLRISRPALART